MQNGRRWHAHRSSRHVRGLPEDSAHGQAVGERRRPRGIRQIYQRVRHGRINQPRLMAAMTSPALVCAQRRRTCRHCQAEMCNSKGLARAAAASRGCVVEVGCERPRLCVRRVSWAARAPMLELPDPERGPGSQTACTGAGRRGSVGSRESRGSTRRSGPVGGLVHRAPRHAFRTTWCTKEELPLAVREASGCGGGAFSNSSLLHVNCFNTFNANQRTQNRHSA